MTPAWCQSLIFIGTRERGINKIILVLYREHRIRWQWDLMEDWPSVENLCIFALNNLVPFTFCSIKIRSLLEILVNLEWTASLIWLYQYRYRFYILTKNSIYHWRTWYSHNWQFKIIRIYSFTILSVKVVWFFTYVENLNLLLDRAKKFK